MIRFEAGSDCDITDSPGKDIYGEDVEDLDCSTGQDTYFGVSNADREILWEAKGECIDRALELTNTPKDHPTHRTSFAEIWFDTKANPDASGEDNVGWFLFSRHEAGIHPEPEIVPNEGTDKVWYWHFPKVYVYAESPAGGPVRRGVAHGDAVGTVAQLGVQMYNEIKSVNAELWCDEDGPEGPGPWLEDNGGLLPIWFTNAYPPPGPPGAGVAPLPPIDTWLKDVHVAQTYVFGGFEHDSFLPLVIDNALEASAAFIYMAAQGYNVLYTNPGGESAIGRGNIGSPRAYVERSAGYSTLMHEFGHNAGLHHANSQLHSCWPNSEPVFPENVMAYGRVLNRVRRNVSGFDEDDCGQVIYEDQVAAFAGED
ncbi:MAG: hypothetical protein JXR94_15155 [Candidatus Hydrogenedentes bacterium]|nr:hypothetical protein [Candidatus Hydrogenedentota bacterium]